MIKLFSCSAVLVLLGAFAGCQQTPANHGSYTRARHMQTGSNIPQPDSASTEHSTYNPDFDNVLGRASTTGSAGRSGQ